MQWGDFVAELWLYVPLIGFWLVAIVLGIAAIAASIRDRQRPGGMDYEFRSSEPEGRPEPSMTAGAPQEARPHAVRFPRPPEENEPPEA
jgi:hypothetical protein